MKKTTKFLSVLMAFVMSITCASFTTTAFAADPAQCATIYFNGTENNSYIDDALTVINTSRSAKGMNPLTLDYTLTEQAKQRAKELFVAYDYNDVALPNGDPVETYIPSYLTTLLYRFYGLPTVEKLNTALSYEAASSYNQLANSVGIGFFTVGEYTAMYAVFSYAPATAVYQNFTDAAVTAGVTTLTSNISLYIDMSVNKSGLCYDCAVKAYFSNGVSAAYIPISNDQVKFKSSKPSVAKYKNSKVYPKKNGSYKITATLNANPAVTVSESYSISGINKPAVKIKSLKSTKKKKLTVKWTNNISDASGYEIQYSTSKKFAKNKTKTVTVKGRKKSSKTIAKLKSKKKYYVRVRAYVDQGQGEKIYGSWSKTKNVKVK